MKTIKMYLGMILITAFTIMSCQTDSINEQSEDQSVLKANERTDAENTSTDNTTIVRHIYTYNQETFNVNYTIDNESGDVLNTEGDLERAEQLFSTDDQASSVLITELEEYNPDTPVETPQEVTIRLEVFDSENEMQAYVESDGVRVPTPDGEYTANAEGPCNDYDIAGQGRFYFYKNWFFGNEMLPLRRVNRNYYRDYAFGSYNDQMSSLIVLKPYNRRSYTILYQHTCLNGRSLGFYQRTGFTGYGIVTLRWYTLYRWWFWRTSWNDQVSSSQGYVY